MIDGQGERNARADDPFADSLEEDPTRAAPRPDPRIDDGFAETAMHDEPRAPHAVTAGSADEALAARVRRELREDAATAHLRLQVSVQDAVATVRGAVNDLEDSDNALAVAGRVPGIDDVVDELEMVESDAS